MKKWIAAPFIWFWGQISDLLGKLWHTFTEWMQGIVNWWWQAFVWLYHQFLDFLKTMGQAIVDAVTWDLQYIWNKVVALAAAHGIDISLGGLPDAVQSLWGVVQDMAWILPLGAMFSIIVSAWAAVLVIRITRHAMRLIPFLNAG
ncbi:MAG: hypothetical protein BIFFINMI_00391 [Phycisphaerae bacterium]|nr:hypothetical protein [Phycisphaerae bacterium]